MEFYSADIEMLMSGSNTLYIWHVGTLGSECSRDIDHFDQFHLKMIANWDVLSVMHLAKHRFAWLNFVSKQFPIRQTRSLYQKQLEVNRPWLILSWPDSQLERELALLDAVLCANIWVFERLNSLRVLVSVTTRNQFNKHWLRQGSRGLLRDVWIPFDLWPMLGCFEWENCLDARHHFRNNSYSIFWNKTRGFTTE
jgi:hypothetical protein